MYGSLPESSTRKIGYSYGLAFTPLQHANRYIIITCLQEGEGRGLLGGGWGVVGMGGLILHRLGASLCAMCMQMLCCATTAVSNGLTYI